jgi:hypothetical protein
VLRNKKHRVTPAVKLGFPNEHSVRERDRDRERQRQRDRERIHYRKTNRLLGLGE